MPYPCPGIRVVRGPGWTGGDQDGGEGHVGTVLNVESSKGRVTVIWDSGKEFQYNAGNNDKFDLLVFDSAPTGAQHKNVICDVCQEKSIAGIRWKCATCTDFDLCTKCYMEGRHDDQHPFLRGVTNSSSILRVPPRKGCPQIRSRGMFPGAQVIRGPHWRYGDQDGGRGTRGEIIKLGTYSGGYVRGAVNVRWEKGQDSINGYRIGAEGLVALTMVKAADGWSYYKDHLPVLDVLHPDTLHFKKGDKVKVIMDLETFTRIQKDHVGFKDALKRCLKDVGTVVRGTEEGKRYIRVQYEDAEMWPIVSSTLTKLHTFSVGDIVKTITNYNAALELQQGHGGWNDKMADCLGEEGEVIAIDADGDMKVKFKVRSWVLSPVVCVFQDRKVSLVNRSNPDTKKSQTMTTSQKGQWGFLTDDIALKLPALLAELDMASVGDRSDVSPLMTAVKADDVEKVKSLLRSLDKSKVDEQIEGFTALHIACYRGKTAIVTSLLTAGSNKDKANEMGDTPLHFAVSGDHPEVVEILMKAKVAKDAKNAKGITPLHMAVGKEDPSVACAKILIKNKADPNTQDKDGDTPLHDAIRSENNELMEALLECSSLDLQLVNSEGFNPFHAACCNLDGDVKFPEKLLQRNKTVLNAVIRPHLFTPLHIAALNGFVALSGFLLTAGAKTNVRDCEGKTPLHLAVDVRSLDLVRLLMESGSGVNLADKEGNTPLHLANMESGVDEDTTKTMKSRDEDATIAIRCHLVENGGKLTLANNAGKTPLDLIENMTVRRVIERLAQMPKSFLSRTKQPPAHWSSMGDKDLRLVSLTPTDPATMDEYKTVSGHLLKSLPNRSVVSIQRVQNLKIWGHYAVAKADMEATYGKGQANEKHLYHGTTPEAAQMIPHQNIDFRLAGKRVGALYGEGAYFAVDAKYSDSYTKADKDKHRFMFQAKVLVGRSRKGERGITRPPVYDPSDRTKLADTACDHDRNPRVYVVFSEKQIYPEYLIEYC